MRPTLLILTTLLPTLPTINQTATRVEGDHRVINSNGLPDHEPGQFPNRGNPNAIRVQRHEYRVPLHPVARDTPTPMHGVFGVALNGVPFDPGTAEWWSPGGRTHDRSSGWNYDALSGKINLGIDEHHAHVQPTGTYHYHGLPTGLIENLREQTHDMTMIGYAADGFPIYAQDGYKDAQDAVSPVVKLTSSYRLKSGTRPGAGKGPGGTYDGTFVQDWEYLEDTGDLDECNGRYGITPEYPAGTYYYVVTDTFPFVPRLFRGTPDRSFRHHGPPRRHERAPHHPRR